jgi:hypothetical protein
MAVTIVIDIVIVVVIDIIVVIVIVVIVVGWRCRSFRRHAVCRAGDACVVSAL